MIKQPSRTASSRRRVGDVRVSVTNLPKTGATPPIPRPEIAAAGSPRLIAPDSIIAGEITHLESESFNADTFVQNKCKAMSEKVRNFDFCTESPPCSNQRAIQEREGRAVEA